MKKQPVILDNIGLVIIGMAASIFYYIVETILHTAEEITIILTVAVLLLFSTFTQFLINKINRSQSDLKKINETLEQKVAERTKELQDSNINLLEEIHIREETEEKLRESEVRYRTIFENTGTATVIIDETKTITLANSVFANISGFPKEDIENKKSWLDFIGDSSRMKILKYLDDPVTNENQIPENYECKFLDKNREEKDILINFATIGGTSKSVASFSDISKLKEAEHQIYHQAFHDSLTNLPNRALFMEHLNMALKRSKRLENYLFAVLYLDIDRFKLINDSLGHIVGDKLLIAFAERLKDSLRDIDSIARFGGDEFVILLDDIGDKSFATTVAERIQVALRDPFIIAGNEIFAPASFGIVLNPEDYELPEYIIRDADAAMYNAKEMGKARFKIFDKTLHEKAIHLLQMETDLRKAIEKHEFELYYHPIVSVKEKTLLGFEALLRWVHPEHGMIYPDAFIPVAEETGLINPMGKWVFERACSDLRNWREIVQGNSTFFISVNLSGKQFSQPHLIHDIQDVLKKTGLNPDLLELEITETVLMEDADEAIKQVSRLKDLGLQIVIDDFGTGYSSLSYLQRLPIDALKVDRGFVSHMLEKNEENKKIVEAILSLSHKLNLSVIAEGVETIEQLSMLSLLNCQAAQGNLFSKPLTSEKVDEIMHNILHLSTINPGYPYTFADLLFESTEEI